MNLKNNLSGLAAQLVKAQILNSDIALQAQNQAITNNTNLIHFVAKNKLADSRSIAELIAKNFGLTLIDLNAFNIKKMPKNLINEKIAYMHRIVPLWKRGNKLFIGTSNPLNQQAVSDIQFATGLSVDLILVEDDKLDLVIEKLFDSTTTTIADLEKNVLDEIKENNISTRILSDDISHGAPIVRFVKKILTDAIKNKASDLHFEPYEKMYRVRFRIDGILYEIARPPIQSAAKISARLKVMASLDISERRKPQDGRIKIKISQQKSIDFRINILPTLWGEKIVMRVLDSSNTQLGIDLLGYEPDQKALYLHALNQPQGMILVTGPTGSGKTVSLYTGLNILNTPSVNISTIEDPVEINLEGINQVNVNIKHGVDFNQTLRAFLRQDPDIIMVGEIRDLETASIAIKASQTGHMVLSTLHTNNAAETLMRLRNMGIPAFNLATSVNLIIAQRLARKLCEHCKTPTHIDNKTLQAEGFPMDLINTFTLFEPKGCQQCTNGYRGRTGIYEVVKISTKLQAIIMNEGNSLDIEKQINAEGFSNLRTSALLKVMRGTTSLSEINRVTKD